jgi:predicted AlkP superfamily pyrophosphatase or phosphodiesterase
LELAYQQINTFSITNWTPINTYICQQYLDYTSESTLNDSMVFQVARDVLVDSLSIAPDVLFLHFDELDVAGHSYGFSPEVSEYTNTLSKIDVFVESLFNIIEEKRNDLGENWLFLIVSDHGGDGTGHGDADNPHINQTIFFSQHPDLNFIPNYITNQTDLAPTILNYMGVASEEIDCKMDGVSIIE